LSLGKFDLSQNGGIALTSIANHYLGTSGLIMLGAMTFVACLKTSIGLTTACSEAFSELIPATNYKSLIIVISILPAIFANVGLDMIISISIPILMFIYPLAILLILFGIFDKQLKGKKWIYLWTTGFTLIACVFSAFENLPSELLKIEWIQNINDIGDYFPFDDISMNWIVPAIIGYIIGFIFQKFSKSPKTI